ncbi:MAG: hypothetical protein QXU11_11860 [Thermoproteota archaeon]|uniref:hypothetical protein n=1 Tax=Thermofilum sp. TaxID=1961369 RepID=UPI003164985C
MFYATLPEKLGFISLLLRVQEKVESKESNFDMKEIEELISPYILLRPYGRVRKEPEPSEFLGVFSTLVDPTYLAQLDKKFEGKPTENSYSIDDIEISKIRVDPSEKIVNILSAHSLLKDALGYIMSNFGTRSTLCDSVIRAIEAFSHCVVVYNLGLPIPKLDKSRSIECDTSRTMLYNLLEASLDIPQFVKLLQNKRDNLQKNYHLKDGENMRISIVPADALAGNGELAKTLMDKFGDHRSFEETGIWFPKRVYCCNKCKKVIPSSEKPGKIICKEPSHPPQKMKEQCGIIIHENLFPTLPYISEYLVVHALRRLLFVDRLSGFLAHSVFLDGEEIDIITLILFKNYVKIFPIEVQISSSIDVKGVEEKFQKLKNLIGDAEYQEYKFQIHNLFITFEECGEKGGENFSICHFSGLNELMRSLIYSSI